MCGSGRLSADVRGEAREVLEAAGRVLHHRDLDRHNSVGELVELPTLHHVPGGSERVGQLGHRLHGNAESRQRLPFQTLRLGTLPRVARVVDLGRCCDQVPARLTDLLHDRRIKDLDVACCHADRVLPDRVRERPLHRSVTGSALKLQDRRPGETAILRLDVAVAGLRPERCGFVTLASIPPHPGRPSPPHTS